MIDYGKLLPERKNTAYFCFLFRRPERTVFFIQFLLHYVAGGLVDSDFLAIRAEV